MFCRNFISGTRIIPRSQRVLKNYRHASKAAQVQEKDENSNPSGDKAVKPRAGHYVKEGVSKPKTNEPFAKNLFLGRFDKVYVAIIPEIHVKDMVVGDEPVGLQPLQMLLQ